MFNVSVNDKKNIYRSKPVMNVDTVPKPLTYDYMPEGYPKKDGWSIEWDGNTEGKISAVGAPICKFSDRGLTYEEFSSAKLVNPSDPSQFIMVSAMRPKQEKFSDAISVFSAGDIQIYVISEDNAEVEVEGIIFPTKGLYTNQDAKPFILITETITPMSTDFIPKNLNVVFKQESGSAQVNCNVTYNELREWVERGIPVFAVFIYGVDSQYSVCNITKTALLTNMLEFVYYDYYNGTFMSKSFAYKSDGTIEIQPN